MGACTASAILGQWWNKKPIVPPIEERGDTPLTPELKVLAEQEALTIANERRKIVRRSLGGRLFQPHHWKKA